MSAFRPADVDEVIHGRMRLGIMAYLAQTSPASFAELARALETTNGNLSVHLRKLEDAGYVRIDKRFEGKKPLTEAAVTPDGRKAWRRYLEALSGLLP